MEMIRLKEWVKNNQITIQMPESLNGTEVEVTVMPLKKERRVFDSFELIAINTKEFRFDRDDIHKR